MTTRLPIRCVRLTLFAGSLSLLLAIPAAGEYAQVEIEKVPVERLVKNLSDAVERYSKLTIGDGLISQVPALLVSTAAAILVTKDTSERSLGSSLVAQLCSSPKAGTIAARMTVWYGTDRYSTIRNAAAPMIGGVIWPPVAAAASTAPAKCRA